MPIFAMMSLDIPIEIITTIEKIIRGFLWKGRKDGHVGHFLVAWDRVCMPKELGGLGIPNLRLMNIALRARWLWLKRVEVDRPWHGLDIRVPELSRRLFDAATTSVIGDGAATFFWTDKWLPCGRHVTWHRTSSLRSHRAQSPCAVCAKALQGVGCMMSPRTLARQPSWSSSKWQTILKQSP